VQGSRIGVGPRLRSARLARGVSLEEASRDTRIRADFLQALEDEDFDRLLGDVYVRGCLRSYSNYLGLPPDALVSRYARHIERPEPEPRAVLPPSAPAVGARRRRDNHRLWVMLAVTALVLAGAFGVLSTREAAPPPADLPTSAPLLGPPADGILVAVLAERDVQVTVRIDAASPQTFSLRPGESRSFEARSRIAIRLDPGASARITVDGRDYGLPGRPRRPWRKTFSYGTGAQTPSSAG
jgi:cytoskeleton protein RodZ